MPTMNKEVTQFGGFSLFKPAVFPLNAKVLRSVYVMAYAPISPILPRFLELAVGVVIVLDLL